MSYLSIPLAEQQANQILPDEAQFKQMGFQPVAEGEVIKVERSLRDKIGQNRAQLENQITQDLASYGAYLPGASKSNLGERLLSAFCRVFCRSSIKRLDRILKRDAFLERTRDNVSSHITRGVARDAAERGKELTQERARQRAQADLNRAMSAAVRQEPIARPAHEDLKPMKAGLGARLGNAILSGIAFLLRGGPKES